MKAHRPRRWRWWICALCYEVQISQYGVGIKGGSGDTATRDRYRIGVLGADRSKRKCSAPGYRIGERKQGKAEWRGRPAV